MSNDILAIKAAVKSVLADASLGQVSKWLSANLRLLLILGCVLDG